MKTHTRHLLTLAVLLGFTAPIGAQTSAVPDQISYQGFVTDTGGNPIGNSTPENRTIVFRIWDHPTNTGMEHLIYSEQQVVTISKGEFSVLVGDGIAVTGETNKGKPTVTIPTAFAGTTRFIGISVYESNGGVAPEISPRQRIVSSAYAYRARFAETLGSNGGTAISTLNDGRVGVGNTNPPSLFTITGANTSTSTSTPQMVITADDVTERLRLGVDSTGNGTGFIQSFKEGTGAQNLLLNPGGGNVGINTTTPLNTLHVNGLISARTSNAAHGYVALQTGDSSNDGYIEWLKPGGGRSAFLGYSGLNNLQLSLAGSHHFLITGSGSVGIGNTAPTAKLDVTGGIKSTGGGGYTFNTGDLDGGLFSPNDGVVTLRTNNTERLRVDGSGNVGVGSSTINHRLQVSGNVMLGTGQPNLSFTPIGDTLYLGQPRKYLSTTLGTAVGGSTDWVNLMCHSLSAGIIFGGATTDATPHSNPAVYMAIKPSGNVGIGTTTPAHKLDVIGGTQSQWLELRANSGTPYIDFSGTTAADFHARIIYAGTGDNRLHFEAAAFTYGPGNVGIGTTTPGARLHIKATSDNNRNSGIRLEHFADTDRWNIHPENTSNVLVFSFNDQYSGSNYSYLSAGQAGLISVSDRRTKKDIQPITGSLAQLMQLRPTSFRYKTAEAGTPLNFGFIAQEVENVYPDIVLEQNGLKTLASNSLIAINTQAIQELKGEKDDEVTALKEEISELKAQLAKVQAKDKARDAKLAAIEKLLLARDKGVAQPVLLKKSAGGAE